MSIKDMAGKLDSLIKKALIAEELGHHRDAYDLLDDIRYMASHLKDEMRRQLKYPDGPGWEYSFQRDKEKMGEY